MPSSRLYRVMLVDEWSYSLGADGHRICVWSQDQDSKQYLFYSNTQWLSMVYLCTVLYYYCVGIDCYPTNQDTPGHPECNINSLTTCWYHYATVTIIVHCIPFWNHFQTRYSQISWWFSSFWMTSVLLFLLFGQHDHQSFYQSSI